MANGEMSSEEQTQCILNMQKFLSSLGLHLATADGSLVRIDKHLIEAKDKIASIRVGADETEEIINQLRSENAILRSELQSSRDQISELLIEKGRLQCENKTLIDAEERRKEKNRNASARYRAKDKSISSRHLVPDDGVCSRHLVPDDGACSRHLVPDDGACSRHLVPDDGACSRHLVPDDGVQNSGEIAGNMQFGRSAMTHNTPLGESGRGGSISVLDLDNCSQENTIQDNNTTAAHVRDVRVLENNNIQDINQVGASAGGASVDDEMPMPTEDPRAAASSPFPKEDDFKGVLPKEQRRQVAAAGSSAVPPTREEAEAYANATALHPDKKAWPMEFVDYWWCLMVAGDWKKDGAPIYSWRQKMLIDYLLWEKRRREEGSSSASASAAAPSAATERYARLFERFWDEYPKHENKMGAEQAFAAVMDGCKSDGERSALVEEMLDAIATLKGTKWANPDDDRFIPMPANWLKSRRWTDEGIVNSDEAIHRRLEEHARKLNLENERYSFRNCHGAVLSDGSVIP